MLYKSSNFYITCFILLASVNPYSCNAFAIPKAKKLIQNPIDSRIKNATPLPFTVTTSLTPIIVSPTAVFASTSSASPDTEPSNLSIRERLLKVSNIASLLCVLDCTVLPLITLALPLLGLGASVYSTEWLDDFGHSTALFFVLPVGGLAATMNYLNHGRKLLLCLSIVGWSCIYAANAWHGAPIVSLLPQEVVHSLHCGTVLHRVTNLFGCACLSSSNLIGRRIAGCGVKDCGVVHGDIPTRSSGCDGGQSYGHDHDHD